MDTETKPNKDNKLEAEFITTLENDGDNYSYGASEIQKRRHPEWYENYQLYRLKAQTNRLTQRQSVNIPLMKETIKTGLAKQDFIDLIFSSRSQNDQSTIDFNEYWRETVEHNNLEVQDEQDTKQEMLYGRSFMKIGIVDGRVAISVEDPMDIIIDRFADPANIDGTANFVEHRHIFRSFSYIKGNKMYDKEGVAKLEAQLSGQDSGTAENDPEMYDNTRDTYNKLRAVGEGDPNNTMLGDVFVELKEQYIRKLDPKDGKHHIFIRVVANNITIFSMRLLDYLGVDWFPIITWASDVDRTDIWSDGVADIVRVPNKVLNAWFSQLVENRTLRNLGMYFYDATLDETWVPQTYDPVAWGWYGVAGDPNKTVKRMDIPDLSESLDEMQYVVSTVERATASTALEKGVPQAGDMTLGEIKIITANANERITDSTKFRKLARLELGEKFEDLVLANKDILTPIKRFKKGFDGKVYSATIDPSTFNEEEGFDVEPFILSDKKAKDLANIQKMQGVLSMFPQNTPLKTIVQKRALSIIDDLTPEEKDEIINFQKMIDERAMNANNQKPTETLSPVQQLQTLTTQ